MAQAERVGVPVACVTYFSDPSALQRPSSSDEPTTEGRMSLSSSLANSTSTQFGHAERLRGSQHEPFISAAHACSNGTDGPGPGHVSVWASCVACCFADQALHWTV